MLSMFSRNPDKLETKANEYERRGKTAKAQKYRQKAANLRANQAGGAPLYSRPSPYSTTSYVSPSGLLTTSGPTTVVPTTFTTTRNPTLYEQNALKWEGRGNRAKAQKNREKFWRLQNPQYPLTSPAPSFYDDKLVFLGYNQPIPVAPLNQGLGNQGINRGFGNQGITPGAPITSGGSNTLGLNKPGIAPTGLTQGGLNQGGIAPSGLNQGGINPTGLNQGVNPIGRIPDGFSQGGINPTGLTQAGTNPLPQGGINPTGLTQGGIYPTGLTQGGINPTGFTQGGFGNQGFGQTTSTTLPPVVETHMHQALVQQTTRPEKIVEVQPIVHRDIDAPQVHVIEQHSYEQVRSMAPGVITNQPIVQETVRPRIIEEVQPIIHREVPAPFVERVEQHVSEHLTQPTTMTKDIVNDRLPTGPALAAGGPLPTQPVGQQILGLGQQGLPPQGLAGQGLNTGGVNAQSLPTSATGLRR